jgi:NADH-quinone oxidoreductase subunit E
LVAHAASPEIDLDVVREIVSQITYQDHQEAQELILFALQEINERFGWVSLEAAEIVAEHLGTTVNRVYGLLTFYADFRTEPRGNHFLMLCHGVSCYVAGSTKILQHIHDEYGSGDGETTDDGELTIQVMNACLGVCDRAPYAVLDGHPVHNLTVERFNDVMQQALAARGTEEVNQ